MFNSCGFFCKFTFCYVSTHSQKFPPNFEFSRTAATKPSPMASAPTVRSWVGRHSILHVSQLSPLDNGCRLYADLSLAAAVAAKYEGRAPPYLRRRHGCSRRRERMMKRSVEEGYPVLALLLESAFDVSFFPLKQRKKVQELVF